MTAAATSFRTTPRRQPWRALAIGLLLVAGAAAGQPYPARPIHFIIPFAAGGGSDVLARVLAEPLAQRLGQPVIVENKPGANANLGADFVAKSAPDGYTWLYTSPGPQIINPYLMGKLPFDPEKDLAPVARLGVFVSVLVVTKGLPVKSVKELIDYAKANPGKLNFASPGIGAASHLSGEYFKTVAGIDIVHVPYKGTGAALQDLIAGNVQMTIDSAAALLPHIRSGALRPLAVTTRERAPILPDVPTLAEYFADFDASPMNYLTVRGGTPPAIVNQINREINAVLAMPAVRARLLDMGVIPSPSTPEELAREIQGERAKWKKVIEASGAKAE